LNNERDRGSDLALLAILVIWVSSYAFFKIGFREVRPIAFTLARFVLMTPVAFIVLWLREGNLRLDRRDIGLLALSSVIGHSTYQILFVTALDWTNASTMALLSSTIPVFAAVFLTASVCELVGCSGCLPEIAFEEDGSRKPEFESVVPGYWTGDVAEFRCLFGVEPESREENE
jgi:uncharacterized membrane protein